MLISIPNPEDALPGRHRAIEVNEKHFVNGNPIKGKFQENIQIVSPKQCLARCFLPRKIEVFCDISGIPKIRPRNNPITGSSVTGADTIR